MGEFMGGVNDIFAFLQNTIPRHGNCKKLTDRVYNSQIDLDGKYANRAAVDGLLAFVADPKCQMSCKLFLTDAKVTALVKNADARKAALAKIEVEELEAIEALELADRTPFYSGLYCNVSRRRQS